MKKTLSKLFILASVAAFSFGCGTIEQLQSSNTNVEDKTRDALGLKKTGIPECDEVVEILTRKTTGAGAAEESWTDKAKNELIKQQIYNYVNDATKTPQEKADMADKCKLALGYLREEPQKK